MDKLNVIHVVNRQTALDEPIFQTMHKSFEMNLKTISFKEYASIVDEKKIHIVLFDNIDYHDISLDLTNKLKEKFAHIHLVLITAREDEQKQMRIYNKRVDHI